MTPEETVVCSITVVTNNPEHITRAAEVMARAAAGLVLEGMSVSVSLFRGDAEGVDDAGT